MDFRKYLDATAKDLDREVERILIEWLKETRKVSPKLVLLAKAFIKSCQGGKRIRGVLVMLGYKIANKESKEILKIGAAYEIFHSAILAHDDIIDQSEIRRGNPSLYKKLGISQAITLGDLGFFLAIRVISQSNFPVEYKNQATRLFAKTIVDTALGQLLDIEKGDPIITAKFKTAHYTITGPLQLGAILAGVENKLIRALGEFGENLGIAFQIKDDILDNDAGIILEQAKINAENYKNKALKVLPSITKNTKLSKLLEQMAEYLVERTK